MSVSPALAARSARGSAPAIAVEYARRAIAPEERPSFQKIEKIMASA